MTTQPDKETAGKLQRLPDCPEVAFFIASVFVRLGGEMVTDSQGRRYSSRPVSLDECHPDGRPQLPEALPHERFHSDEEWNGAIKLADYWLNRLSDRDKEFVFTLCAPVRIDPRKPFDFRDRLQ